MRPSNCHAAHHAHGRMPPRPRREPSRVERTQSVPSSGGVVQPDGSGPFALSLPTALPTRKRAVSEPRLNSLHSAGVLSPSRFADSVFGHGTDRSCRNWLRAGCSSWLGTGSEPFVAAGCGSLSMSGAPRKMAKPGGTKRRIRRGSVNDNDRGVHWTGRWLALASLLAAPPPQPPPTQ